MILMLLCLLFGLSGVPMIYSLDHNENQIVNHNVVDKEAFYFIQYDVYTSSELLSVENFVNYVNWVYRADGIDLYTINSSYERGFNLYSSAWFGNSQLLTTSNFESADVDVFHLNSMAFHAEPRVVQDANRNYQYFYLNFYSSLDSSVYLSIAFTRVYNATLGGIYTWYCEGMYLSNHGVMEYYSPTIALIVKNPTSTNLAWTRQFFNFYGQVSDDTNIDNYNLGYSAGRTDGFNDGYQEGYQDALDSEASVNPEMYTIFTGILNVALLPVNVFLTILNFEIFGINIAGFVTSLLTIGIVVIILRFIFGGKNNDS